MSRTLRGIATITAGAMLAVTAAGGVAQARPSPARSPSPAPVHFTPPHRLSGADVLSVAGRPGMAQTIELRGVNQHLKVGEVVVSDVSASAPEGLFGRVTGVQVVGNHTVVKTTLATLADASGPGTYRAHVALNGSTRAQVATRSGKTMRPAASTANPHQLFPFKTTVTCSGSFKSATLSGSFKVNPSVDIGWTAAPSAYFPWLPTITEAHAIAGLTQDMTLRASLGGSASCGLNLTIATISIPFVIAGVPSTLVVGLKLDTTLTAAGSTAIMGQEHLDGTIGMKYTQLGGEVPVSGSHFEGYIAPPTFSGSAKLEAGLTALVGVKIAGIVGPQINARGYVGIQGNTAQAPRWRAYDGVNVNGTLEVNVPILNLPVLKLATIPIWSHEWTIATANDGRLWHTVRNADGSWVRADDAAAEAGIPGAVSSETGVSTAPGVDQFMVVTGDGRLWHTLRSADGSWTPAGNAAAAAGIPGTVVSASGVSTSPGVAQYLVVTSDGRLWHTIRNADGSWTGAGDAAAAAGIPGVVVSTAAVSASAGVAQFLVITSDGRLWHMIRNADGSWTQAGDAEAAAGIQGLVTSAAAVSTTAGVAQFLITTSDGRLWHTIRNADGTWVPAGDAGAVARVPGAAVSVGAVSAAPGAAQFVIVTSDGRLWHTLRSADGSWTPAGDAESAAGVSGAVESVTAAPSANGAAQFLISA